MPRRCALLLVCLLAAAAPARAEEPPLWVAVGPEDLLAALEPLARHRAREGMEARLVPLTVEAALAGLPRPPAYLLLVGDDDPEAADAPWRNPAVERTTYRWHPFQDPDFPSDAIRGDLDGDLVPEFPVGRIPARSPEEVGRVVRKILEFERRPPRETDLRLLALAGNAEFGRAIDAMTTGIITDVIRRFSPPWLDRHLLTSQLGHPLSGWPPDLAGNFDREYRRGALLAAFLAHASETSVHLVKFGKQRLRYDAKGAASRLAGGPPGPPLLIIACLAGRFTASEPCLSERLLALDGGPVAVVAATSESHPLTNFYSGRGVLAALASGRSRIGDVWLAAQRSVLTDSYVLAERLLLGIEGSLEGRKPDVRLLKRDHLLVYAIFGDPATRLKLPGRLPVRVTQEGDGRRWRVEKVTGASGLDLWFRPPPVRARLRAGIPESPEEGRAQFEEAHRTEAYRKVRTLEGEGPWEGVWTDRGWLRFVARTEAGFLVHAERLR